MKKRLKCFMIGFWLVFLASGCAYRHYMGMHGPSIKLYPEAHQQVAQEDNECLKCHHPDRDPEGPPTTHPGFTGCLKCHNGNV